MAAFADTRQVLLCRVFEDVVRLIDQAIRQVVCGSSERRSIKTIWSLPGSGEMGDGAAALQSPQRLVEEITARDEEVFLLRAKLVMT